MYGLEEDLFTQLNRLKEQFGISYVKAEFEAEGASFRDLVRLRRLTSSAGLGLILKIGGCEAIRDLRDALELGADGIVAPMIESPFALFKFWEAVNKVFRTGRRPRLAFNVETRTCLDQLEPILDAASGKMDSFTIGRTDLSGSYLDPEITPESPFLLNELERVVGWAKLRGWDIWMGGSLCQKSISGLSSRAALRGHVSHFETRKIVIPAPVLWSRPEIVSEALKFEELYLLSRKEILEGSYAEDLHRLEVLKKRY